MTTQSTRRPWRAGDRLPPAVARTARWGLRAGALAAAYRIGYTKGYQTACLDAIRDMGRGLMASIGSPPSRLDPTSRARESIRTGRWL